MNVMNIDNIIRWRGAVIITIRSRIREIRKSRGINSVYVSRELGKYDSWLSKVEHNGVKLSVEDVPQLAKILFCTIDDILMPHKIFDPHRHD